MVPRPDETFEEWLRRPAVQAIRNETLSYIELFMWLKKWKTPNASG